MKKAGFTLGDIISISIDDDVIVMPYYDFYQITPAKDPQTCNTLVSLRLNMCLMHYSGVYDEAQLPMLTTLRRLLIICSLTA